MDKQQTKQEIAKLVKKYERLSPTEIQQYNEANTRKNFILPLFRALGWDTSGEEVIEEARASGKRVDYAFKLGGITEFFLEAKPLSVNLDELRWAEQAVWYAWHKGVPWAVLTDFESIKVFNAEWDEQEAERSLVFEIPYQDYLTDEKLWYLSRKAIEKGELDEYAEKEFKKPKRAPVDAQLAADLLRWRDELFDNFNGLNSSFGEKSIAEAVQRVLNRLIFIRTCEDRGLEERVLQEAVRNYRDKGRSGDELIKAIRKLFSRFDVDYDSRLFQEPTLFDSEKFEVFDDVLAKVIEETYKSSKGIRWNFAAIGGDVLGSIYEQYLGKIQAGEKEKKSGKRKAQGIYYTPRYIVNHIVKNTLGEVLKGKSAFEASKIRILDPACGSGSFLIKAFEVLDEHIRRESKITSDALKDYARRIGILTSNIYGVDLDKEAAEIAQLNLLLRALVAKECLPNLEHIQCGNSLISGAEKELEKYFGKNWKEKKPFNWQEKFPEVFKEGGFDVIIGNPPYVNLANIRNAKERYYLKKNFSTAKNKSDLYSFFTERAITLLKPGGILGFIISNSWLGTDSFSKFREYLVKNTTVSELVKLSLGVFKDATVTPVLIFLKKEKSSENHKIKLREYRGGKFEELPYRLAYKRIINSPNFAFSFNPFIDFKISTVKLGDGIAKFSLGIKTSDDKKFILNDKTDEDCYKLLRGKDVERYTYEWAGKWLWYKPELMMKKVGAGPRKKEYFLTDKIMFRSITGGSIIATFDDEKFFTNDKVHILYAINGDLLMKFILGIVNSKLINFWLKSTFSDLLEVKINQLEQIPIPKLDFKKSEDKKRHNDLVKLVDRMLILNKKLQKLDPIMDDEEYKEIKAEIAKTDKEIDDKVYKLYGLAPEEIKIVEGLIK